MKRKVCIIQPVMKQYRLPFFTGLRDALQKEGIDLVVVYGTPWKQEAIKGDNVDLPAPLGRRISSVFLFNRVLIIPTLAWWSADLVIVEQANKNLLNYFLLLLRALGLKRVAFWGHGRNMQAKNDSWREIFKRKYLKAVDWWFAYTAGARDYVAGQGFDPSRITTVENAVDTRALREDVAAISQMEKDEVLRTLGWGKEHFIAVYCGSLYPNKYVDVLIRKSDAFHAEREDFRLLIIGGGPEEERLRSMAAEHPWVTMVGPRFGRRKAVMLSLCRIWLNPGLVGLGVLDSFCAGLPIITRRLGPHSPELEYIVSGENGYISESAEWPQFRDLVIDLLNDEPRLEQLRAGALESGKHYSIETMVRNFSSGILECLAR